MKIDKNLKMSSFSEVFDCSNLADREKDRSNHHFPSNFQEIFN